MDALLVMGGGPGEDHETQVETVEQAIEWAVGFGFSIKRAKAMWFSEKPGFTQYGTDYYYLCVTQPDAIG